MTEAEFKIKTERFEGPLDLLLSLIEKRKLLINDISLAKVTDDYIEHIKNSERLSLKKESHFILIASTLVLIKSKSLLPTLELTEEEEGSIEELETRLKIYKRMKEVGLHIEERFGKKVLFEKQYVKPVQLEPVFTPSEKISRQSMLEYARGVIKTLPIKEKLQQIVVDKVVSLEEMINKLTDRIKSGLQMSFKEFSGSGTGVKTRAEKVNVIVSFLAMLELVRNGILNVRQESKYDDIHMETKDVGTPNYS